MIGILYWKEDLDFKQKASSNLYETIPINLTGL